MHAVFRIGNIIRLRGEKPIYKVDLTLTADDDKDLHELTECMQKNVTGSNDWIRLAKVLLMAGHSSTAEKVYINLLKQKPNPTDEGHYYHHLALSNDRQCDYPKGIGYYKAAIMIREKILYDKMVWLAASHRKLALQHTSMEQAAEAQHCKEIANEYENLIDLLELPAFIPFQNEDENSDLDTSSNIAGEIASRKELLPDAVNSLASSYDNIGVVYTNRKKYNEALFYHMKALEIRDGLLPAKDFSLAISYNNIGTVYFNTDKKQEAFQLFKKALAMAQETQHALHPNLAVILKNMGAMFLKLDRYSDAKSCYEKTLRIQQRTLPATHADLYSTYANLGTVYFHMGEYSQALSYHQKTLGFFLSDSSANRNELSTCYNNMGVACFSLGLYFEALDYLEKARNVRATHFGLTAPETVAVDADIAYVCNMLYNSVKS